MTPHLSRAARIFGLREQRILCLHTWRDAWSRISPPRNGLQQPRAAVILDPHQSQLHYRSLKWQHQLSILPDLPLALPTVIYFHLLIPASLTILHLRQWSLLPALARIFYHLSPCRSLEVLLSQYTQGLDGLFQVDTVLRHLLEVSGNSLAIFVLINAKKSAVAAPSPLAMSGLRDLPYAGSSVVPTPEATPDLPPIAGFKRLRRTSSHHSPSPYISAQPAAEAWTPVRQQLLEYRLARLTASANLSHSWVENYEFRKILSEFIPGASPISRKVLTQRLIPQALKAMRAATRSKVKGSVVTLHTDGWSGGNSHHYQAFSVTAVRVVCLIISLYNSTLLTLFISLTQFVLSTLPLNVRLRKACWFMFEPPFKS